MYLLSFSGDVCSGRSPDRAVGGLGQETGPNNPGLLRRYLSMVIGVVECELDASRLHSLVVQNHDQLFGAVDADGQGQFDVRALAGAADMGSVCRAWAAARRWRGHEVWVAARGGKKGDVDRRQEGDESKSIRI